MDVSQEERISSSSSRVAVPAVFRFSACPDSRGQGVGEVPHHAPIGIKAIESELVPVAHVALQKVIGISRPCPGGTDVWATHKGASSNWLMTRSHGWRRTAQAGMGPLSRLDLTSATTGYHSGSSINETFVMLRMAPGLGVRSSRLVPSCLPRLGKRPWDGCGISSAGSSVLPAARSG